MKKGEVMEQQKKKNHPSLPSNYVTLAQLQERWLKQHNQVNQQNQQQEEEDRGQQKDQQQQQQHVAVVAPTNATDSVSRSHLAKQYHRKNRRNSAKVVSEDRRKSETGDGIGNEKADVDGKVGESKKKNKKKKAWKVKRKPKVEKRGASEEGTAAAQGNKHAQKTTTASELNDKKNSDSIITVEEEVEQKFGDLSMNSGNGKQNEGLRRMNGGFRGSQSQRNYRGGRGRRYGHSRGQQRFEVGMQKSEKMVWVRKDRGVGEN